jgi:hypothetical protein
MSLQRDQLKNHIVKIIATWNSSAGNPKTIVGTGFFISYEGHLLTCHHVIFMDGRKADLIQAIWDGQPLEVNSISLSAQPEYLDYALLRLKSGSLPPDARFFKIGEWIPNPSREENVFFTFGFRPNPLEAGLYAQGYIYGEVHPEENKDITVLQLQSSLNIDEVGRQGMSGAPVYHTHSDRVVGMVLGRLQDSQENIPLAVPIKWICEAEPLVKELANNAHDYDLLLEILRSEFWFTDHFRKALYDALPLTDLERYESLGEDKAFEIVEIFWQRNQLDQLILHVEDCFKYILIQPLRKRLSVNFVNRKYELEKAFRDQIVDTEPAPYLFFEAPAGYGKTELLHAIAHRYFKDGWFFAYVDLPKPGNGKDCTASELMSLIAKAFGCPDLEGKPIEEISIVLPHLLKDRIEKIHHRDSFGVALIIDSAEYLDEKEIERFLECLRKIDEKFKEAHIPFKVRIAGRKYGSTWVEIADLRCDLPVEVVPLSPFRLQFVRETIRRKNPSQEFLNTYAAWLMFMTGGHPGCMATVMSRVGSTKSVEAQFISMEPVIRAGVLSTIQQIENSIPLPLRPYFEKLSVFRCYSLHLLETMQQMGVVPASEDILSLEEKLMSNFLVSRPDNFIRDNIVRRLFALKLLWNDPATFLNLCQIALSIYSSELNVVEDDIAVMVLECLYQELQYRFFSSRQDAGARSKIRNEFFHGAPSIVDQYLLKLASKKKWKDAARIFYKQLIDNENDTALEFRFAVNFMLRENEYTEEPFRTLVKNTKNFCANRGLRL